VLQSVMWRGECGPDFHDSGDWVGRGALETLASLVDRTRWPLFGGVSRSNPRLDTGHRRLVADRRRTIKKVTIQPADISDPGGSVPAVPLAELER
jgi:hypothetical protein